MTVHPDRMARNLDITCGALFSQTVLLALVEGGMTRDEAYRIVQESAQRAWDTQTPLRDLLAEKDLGLDLDAIFDYSRFTRHVPELIARLDAYSSPHEPAAARRARRLRRPLPRDPAGDPRPVPLRRARRPQGGGHRRARARPHRGARARHRGGRPVRARARLAAQPGRRLPVGRDRDRPAGGEGARDRRRDRAARLPARVGRPAARRGRRACRRRRGVRPPPAPQDGRPARRHPPRPGRRRRRHGRRR